MMKKTGPPVPPRPNAILVANALAKSRFNAPTSATTAGLTRGHSRVIHGSPMPATTMIESTRREEWNSSSDTTTTTTYVNTMDVAIAPSANVKNKILINDNSLQKTTSGSSTSVPTVMTTVEKLKPLQIETYTKSPSMMRAKRMGDYEQNASSSSGSNKVALNQNQGAMIMEDRPALADRVLISGPKITPLFAEQQPVVIMNSSSNGGVNNNRLNVAADYNFLDCDEVQSAARRGGAKNCVGVDGSEQIPRSNCNIITSNNHDNDDRNEYMSRAGSGGGFATTFVTESQPNALSSRIGVNDVPNIQTTDRVNHGSSDGNGNIGNNLQNSSAVQYKCNILHQPFSALVSEEVVVVGGSTITASPSFREAKETNCNRIEIKAREFGGEKMVETFEGNRKNWQFNGSPTTLLLRSGSSASSESSLSSSSSTSLTNSHSQRLMTTHQESPTDKRAAVDQMRPSTTTLVLPGTVRPDPEGGEAVTDKHEKADTPAVNIVQLDKLPTERKVAFHEKLISELAAMHRGPSPNSKPTTDWASSGDSDDVMTRRARFPSMDRSPDTVSPNGSQRSRIRTADWIEVGDNGKQVVFSSCQISLEDSGLEDEIERLEETSSSGVGDSWDSVIDNDERINMTMPGLPPLPKSLSGFELAAAQQQLQYGLTAITEQAAAAAAADGGCLHGAINNQGKQQPNDAMQSPLARKSSSTLDTQLSILRREMFGLRQLDLSLLSQLWRLNESIQDFRKIIQDQEILSPPSPSQSISDNSISSGDEEESPIEVPNRLRTAPLNTTSSAAAAANFGVISRAV